MLHITFYTKNHCSRSILIRIRIHWIHMILGIPEPDLDPLVRGMDPDPDPTLLWIWIQILLSSSKNSKKTLIPTVL